MAMQRLFELRFGQFGRGKGFESSEGMHSDNAMLVQLLRIRVTQMTMPVWNEQLFIKCSTGDPMIFQRIRRGCSAASCMQACSHVTSARTKVVWHVQSASVGSQMQHCHDQIKHTLSGVPARSPELSSPHPLVEFPFEFPAAPPVLSRPLLYTPLLQAPDNPIPTNPQQELLGPSQQPPIFHQASRHDRAALPPARPHGRVRIRMGSPG